MDTVNSGSRRSHIRVLAGANLLALFIALAALLSGCGSGQKTTSSPPKTTASKPAHANPYVLVRITNDTPATVKFIQCTTTSCAVLHEERTIAAGASNSILGENDGTKFVYVVEDTTGKRIGCVYMKFDGVAQGQTVLISSMKPCE